MKYFTPELYQQGQSPDDDVQATVDTLWEEMLVRYEEHLKQIEPELAGAPPILPQRAALT